MIAEDSNVVFPAAQVKAFIARPPVVVEKETLEFIFTAIDPSGGGHSELAMVSLTDMGGKILVSFLGVLGSYGVGSARIHESLTRICSSSIPIDIK